jgi:hypothetical protein
MDAGVEVDRVMRVVVGMGGVVMMSLSTDDVANILVFFLEYSFDYFDYA